MAAGLWFLLKHTSLGLRCERWSTGQTWPRPVVWTGVARRPSPGCWARLMAAVAGVAGAPIFNSLTSATYLYVLLVATAAAVLGGLRSVPLAALGGLFIGAVQSLRCRLRHLRRNPSPGSAMPCRSYSSWSGLAVWGRERGRRTGQVADDVPPPDYLALRPRWRRVAPWVFWFAVSVRLHRSSVQTATGSAWPPRASPCRWSSSPSPS